MFISVYCYWGNFGAAPIPNDGLTTLFSTDNAPLTMSGRARRAELGDELRALANKDHRAGPQAGTSICLRRILRRSHPPTHSTAEL